MKGLSIFIDNDFVCKNLLGKCFISYTLTMQACVQYEYEPEKMSTTKMGGEKCYVSQEVMV